MSVDLTEHDPGTSVADSSKTGSYWKASVKKIQFQDDPPVVKLTKPNSLPNSKHNTLHRHSAMLALS